MGMLWDGRWETLPLREYFCLPYDKNAPRQGAAFIRQLTATVVYPAVAVLVFLLSIREKSFLQTGNGYSTTSWGFPSYNVGTEL